MGSPKRDIRYLLFTLTGIVSVLVLEIVWIYNGYQLNCNQLMVEAKDAFGQAYQKEQTYRIPFVDIVNPGAVTIESCRAEEVQIIRQCPEPDTIVYNNLSGHSIESFINRVFVDLREHITPMNIYCLADLFAGMLHDKDIPVYFVVERFDISSGEVLDSSLLPDKKQPKANPETTVVMDISDKEALRAVLQLESGVIFRRMAGTFAFSVLLVLVLIVCLCLLSAKRIKGSTAYSGVSAKNPETLSENGIDNLFSIGQYHFNPAKNELQGFGESVQLNKKENSILYMLCLQCGNVVERSVLLEENWGSNGVIYSRSLDTYIATLRKYLKKDDAIQIVTIKGVGYKLVY
ncbi:MAG: winged helix-turn-helix domain-containing protein [Tannerella sp.]|jgi:tetrahydromethanopterin S-methyltransferase subunit F|nr:winged helix-turn-helix domain-containing protein [Tannerella sp.]